MEVLTMCREVFAQAERFEAMNAPKQPFETLGTVMEPESGLWWVVIVKDGRLKRVLWGPSALGLEELQQIFVVGYHCSRHEPDA